MKKGLDTSKNRFASTVNQKKEILVTRSSMPPIEEYIEMIRPLWDSHWLTNMGTYHKQLEQNLAAYLETEYISLTSNGHMALELSIQSMKFPAGSEIITTPFTFISTTHAILRNGLIPIFCDIKEDYTIDEDKIEDLITENTVAILPVHVYGNICNIEKIHNIAYKYDLKVIYDAAHAFGEKYHGQGVGRFGDLSIFSFHATKVYNTIEGGAICCRDRKKWEELYNLKNFGIRSEELVVSVGANAKMNEFQAAMGLCNLRHMEEEIEKRKIVWEHYSQLLKNRPEIRLNTYSQDIEPNYAYFPILLESEEKRKQTYARLLEHGVHARKYFYPLTSDAACFKNKYRSVPLVKARDYASRVLVLPLYADLEMADVDRIAELI